MKIVRERHSESFQKICYAEQLYTNDDDTLFLTRLTLRFLYVLISV